MRNKKWRLFGALATAALVAATVTYANAPNKISVQDVGISQTGTIAGLNNGVAIADIAFPPATTGGALAGAELATAINGTVLPQIKITAAVIGAGVNNAINKSVGFKNNPGVVTTKEVNDLILPTATVSAAVTANGNPRHNTFGALGANWLATTTTGNITA